MHRCKTELDQLLKGLENLGVLELVRANTKMMREIFLGKVIMKNVTADLIFFRLTSLLQGQTGGSKKKELSCSGITTTKRWKVRVMLYCHLCAHRKCL